MKKTVLFIISCLAFNIIINAQHYCHFPDSNAIWTEVYYPPDGGVPESYCFGLLNKDTLINSIKYHKLYKSNDTIFQESEYYGGIREDTISKRFYYYGRLDRYDFDWEMCIYDFSINVGDTVQPDNTNDFLIVSTIDSILIGGSFRKQISFIGFPRCKWIEGIGSIRGLFDKSGALPTSSAWNDLVCFKQNRDWLFHNTGPFRYNFLDYSDCFPVVTGIEEIQKHETNIQIFPNPVTDVSIIKLYENDYQYNRLEIFNAEGVKYSTYCLKGETEVEISKSSFTKGIYLYCLYGIDGFRMSGKFIVY